MTTDMIESEDEAQLLASLLIQPPGRAFSSSKNISIRLDIHIIHVVGVPVHTVRIILYCIRNDGSSNRSGDNREMDPKALDAC
jgi:hypothetical protein